MISRKNRGTEQFSFLSNLPDYDIVASYDIEYGLFLKKGNEVVMGRPRDYTVW
jgi:hypothetical protein